MTSTRYRIMFLGLGVAFALVVVFAVVWAPEGREFRLPAAVESISPAEGAIVQRQIGLQIDMQVGYEIELFIDGFRIPEGEIGYTRATGRYVWEPGPNTTFSEWSAGAHSVRINYERTSGRVDVGAFGWVFRVQ